MDLDSPAVARIGGTAALVLVLALSWLVLQLRFAPPAGSIEVSATLSEAGIGLANGSDVKVRGVRVGEVISVELDEAARPEIRLRLQPGTRIPTTDLVLAVTPKTFFGEKQINLDYPLEAFGTPPFLADGDVITTTTTVTEVEDVLGSLQPVLDAIDERDIATLFEASAALEGEGERIARSLEVGAELAAFTDEIADATVRNARLLTSVSDQLAGAAPDFDRLNARLPAAVAILSERRDEIRSNLDALSSFALVTATWLDVEEDRFDELLATGDVVGAFLERNIESLPSLIEGLKLFAEVQSRPSPFLDDGGIYAPFKIFLDVQGPLAPVLDALSGGASATSGGSD